MLKNSMTVCPDGTSFDAAGSITDIKCTAKIASPAIAGDAFFAVHLISVIDPAASKLVPSGHTVIEFFMDERHSSIQG